MLTEAELQKQWERLTCTDDFIFARVRHDENITRQGRFLENSTTGVLRGGQPPSGAGERGGFRRGKPPLPSRGVVPS